MVFASPHKTGCWWLLMTGQLWGLKGPGSEKGVPAPTPNSQTVGNDHLLVTVCQVAH